MAKKVIKISESRLCELVMESVERKLNEISFTTAKDAHDKMKSKGQTSRAWDLHDTFAKVNNDDNAEYSLATDTMTLKGDVSYDDENHDKQKASEYFHRNDNGIVDMYPRYRRLDKNGVYNGDDSQRNANSKSKHRITTNPKAARNMARHMKNFDPDTEMTKDDFRL